LPETPIDGFDIYQLLTGVEGAESPYEALFYYRRRQLQAVRWKDWKYHLRLEQTHPNWTSAEEVGKGRAGKLVNLKTDLQETTDVSSQHPEVMSRMAALIEQATATLGNDDRQGSEQRGAATLPSSAPMVLGDGPGS
jgi:hypothetical protein